MNQKDESRKMCIRKGNIYEICHSASINEGPFTIILDSEEL